MAVVMQKLTVVEITLEDDEVGLGEVLEKVGRFGIQVPLRVVR